VRREIQPASGPAAHRPDRRAYYLPIERVFTNLLLATPSSQAQPTARPSPRGPISVLREARLRDAPQQLDPVTLERLRLGLRMIALRSFSDAEAAEEVVQETLARGLGALEDGRLDDPARLAAYFRGICHHVIVDTIRTRQRTTSLDALPERASGNPNGDALHVLITQEQKERVIRALKELSPASRECLRLSFYEGLKPAEVAARLGEPGPRIRKRRSRALQHLREVFFEQMDSIGGHEMEESPTKGADGRDSETADPPGADE
jgi:RNA polymerase sigma factor (sigma-70 family)